MNLAIYFPYLDKSYLHLQDPYVLISPVSFTLQTVQSQSRSEVLGLGIYFVMIDRYFVTYFLLIAFYTRPIASFALNGPIIVIVLLLLHRK